MTAQIICKEGHPEYAVVPYSEYQALLEKAEALDDVATFDQAVRALDEGRDQTVPAHVADRLVAGDNPVKVWREHRELTQTALAARAGLSQSHIAMIERGDRQITTRMLPGLAKALEVDRDDLLDAPDL